MTGLLIGIVIGVAICFKLGYYDVLLERFKLPARVKPPLPNHLSCGRCCWITREEWQSPLPPILVDQLVISLYCVEHGPFSYKRWNQKLLDDKGLHKPWETDVDNYRGFLDSP